MPLLSRRQLILTGCATGSGLLAANGAPAQATANATAAAPRRATVQSWPLNTPSRTGIHDLAPAPDGGVWCFMLFLGTMFAPTQDRHGPGAGFTHDVGDTVRIGTARLGTLVNRVEHCERAAPWQFGIGALMKNLAQRGLL